MAHALQVLGIIPPVGVIGLGALKIGCVNFDRRPREDARKAKQARA
ncbi:hypothetical protein [uncultured Methylobacterium sp.]